MRVDRLTSAAELRRVLERLEGGAPSGELPSEGLAVRVGGETVLAAGLARETARPAVPGLQAREVVLAPVHLSGTPEARRAAVRWMLRAVMFGDSWQVVTIRAREVDTEIVIDAAWRYASLLGLAFELSPAARTGAAPVVRIYANARRALVARAGHHSIGALRSVQAASPADAPPDEATLYFIRDLSEPIRPVAVPEGLLVRPMTTGEVERDPAEFGTSVERVERSLLRGDDCWGAFLDGRLVWRRWVSTDAGYIASLFPPELVVHPAAYFHDARSVPEVRGRGIAPAATVVSLLALRDAGFARVLSRISAGNASSQRSVAKTGFVRVGSSRPEREGPAGP